MIMPKALYSGQRTNNTIIINELLKSPPAIKETKQVREASNSKISCKMSCDSWIYYSETSLSWRTLTSKLYQKLLLKTYLFKYSKYTYIKKLSHLGLTHLFKKNKYVIHTYHIHVLSGGWDTGAFSNSLQSSDVEWIQSQGTAFLSCITQIKSISTHNFHQRQAASFDLCL